jgi:septal ring factor EnvC (AmiA/AmiB activator)
MKYFASLFFLIVSFSFSQEAASANPNSQAQLNTVNNKIVALKKTLTLKKTQRVKLESELKNVDIQVSRMTRELDTIDKKMAQQQTALSDSRKQLIALRKENAFQKDILGKQLCATYQLGEHEYLQLLLNQQNPATVQRLMTYYSYINKSRVETIEKIQKIDRQIQQHQDEIKKQIAQLSQLSHYAETKKTLLEKNRQRQQTLMTQLNHDIVTQSSQLKTYETDKKFLTALIQRLSRASIKTQPTIKSSKAAQTPQAVESSAPMIYKIKTGAFSQEAHHLIWPTRGKLLNRANSPIMRHQAGIVILAPEGQHIVSVFPGKVVFAGPLKGFGLLLIIDHGQGYMTLYAHNQALYQKRGAMVKAGDLIAAVGHTGILPQSGLYFEIRHFGHPLNPLQWLAPAGTR